MELEWKLKRVVVERPCEKNSFNFAETWGSFKLNNVTIHWRRKAKKSRILQIHPINRGGMQKYSYRLFHAAKKKDYMISRIWSRNPTSLIIYTCITDIFCIQLHTKRDLQTKIPIWTICLHIDEDKPSYFVCIIIEWTYCDIIVEFLYGSIMKNRTLLD